MPADTELAPYDAFLTLRAAQVNVRTVVRVLAPDRYQPLLEVLYVTQTGAAETAYLEQGEEPVLVVGW